MSDLSDYKSEIDAWADMWDEMRDKNMHPAPEKPRQSDFANKILGDDPQDSYYNSLDMNDDLLQESQEVTQNPVRMDTVGPDDKHPKAAWVQEDFLTEIESLKQRLFKLENDMARMGQGKTFSEKPVDLNNGDLMKKIESIRSEIEAVSSKLGVKDDPTPFVIKKS